MTETDLNAAYTERTHLVALLAQLYPSGWDYADPSTPDWPVVFIDLPTGQAAWHISPEDWWICACVPRRHNAERDGHTTAEKYQRIRDLIFEIEKNHPDHTQPKNMITVSGVCTCSRCEIGQRRIYRMVGACANCQTGPILMLFRAGDPVMPLDCPRCGCKTVHAKRYATDDEIPGADAAVPSGTEEASESE